MDGSGDHQRQPKMSGGNAWPRAGWPMRGERGKSLTAQHAALQLIHNTVRLRGCRRFAKAFGQQRLAVSTFARENFRKWSRDQTVPCIPKEKHQSPHSHMFCKQCSRQFRARGKKKSQQVGSSSHAKKCLILKSIDSKLFT